MPSLAVFVVAMTAPVDIEELDRDAAEPRFALIDLAIAGRIEPDEAGDADRQHFAEVVIDQRIARVNRNLRDVDRCTPSSPPPEPAC